MLRNLIILSLLSYSAFSLECCEDLESIPSDCILEVPVSSDSQSSLNPQDLPSDSDSLSKLLEIEALLSSYSTSISNFQLQISDYRTRLHFLIDQICDSHTQTLTKLSSSFTPRSQEILKNISQHSTSDAQALLSEFPSEFVIDETEVKQALSSMIFIGNDRRAKLESDSLNKARLTSLVSDLKKENEELKKNLTQTASIALSLSTGSSLDLTEEISYEDALIRFHYFVKPGTNVLVRQDKLLKSYIEIDLTSYITVPLENPACIMLPDFKVMIAGGQNRAETYRFNPKNSTLIKLKDLNYARIHTTLCVYKEYLYAFGGIVNGHWSATVERMDWRKNGWTRMADMNFIKSDYNCYGVDNTIYLIGGSNHAVNYYDIRNNAFSTLNGVSIDKLSVGSLREVNGVLYFLNGQSLTVLSSSMKIIYRNERINRNGTLYWIMKGEEGDSLIVSFEEMFMRIHKENDDFDILERVLFIA